MSKRSFESELLDLGPSYYTLEEYEGCLQQLAYINRFLGGDRATWRTFYRLKKPKSILEIGCGRGDFSLQLARYFPNAQIIGIDPSAEAITIARCRLKQMSLTNVQFEIASFPDYTKTPNSFDIITTTLVCHHLDDKDLSSFLHYAYQVASQAVIINDLHRHRLAYGLFFLLSRTLFRNRLIANDGLLSIQRAFKRNEWWDLIRSAQIPPESCQLTWHWAFRWILCINTSDKK